MNPLNSGSISRSPEPTGRDIKTPDTVKPEKYSKLAAKGLDTPQKSVKKKKVTEADPTSTLVKPGSKSSKKGIKTAILSMFEGKVKKSEPVDQISEPLDQKTIHKLAVESFFNHYQPEKITVHGETVNDPQYLKETLTQFLEYIDGMHNSPANSPEQAEYKKKFAEISSGDDFRNKISMNVSLSIREFLTNYKKTLT